MALFYDTPHTSWLNTTKSRWIPVRAFFAIMAFIRTVVTKAKVSVGNKWVTPDDVTSERTDV